MNDEATLVVVLLLGIAAMCVVGVRYQRNKEARLAALREIEIPIESVPRTVLIVLLSMVVGPLLVIVLAAATDPSPRDHAAAVGLISTTAGVAGLFAGLRLSRGYRRIGSLRYTPVSLDLEFGDERLHIDLRQPYQLDEACALGPGKMPLQVLVIKQGDSLGGFSYSLPMTKKPHGERTVEHYLTPLVGGEARVIHDRLRGSLPQPWPSSLETVTFPASLHRG